MNAPARIYVLKTTTRDKSDDPLEFVLSDDSKDRMGDIIEQDGWQLDNFKRNPVALFGHDSRTPIGRWSDVAVKGNRLLGRLHLAAAGTSQRIDELRSLVEQGILRAVSVGFRAIEHAMIDEGRGMRFIKQELLEV